jgi:hypothetical protein
MLNIPVITISERSLAQAFEKALTELYTRGIRFKTQYDKPGDPESLDCTLNLTIGQKSGSMMLRMAYSKLCGSAVLQSVCREKTSYRVETDIFQVTIFEKK